MKTIIFILLVGITISCAAQKKIANLKNNTVERASESKYNVKIEDNRVSLINASNKLTGVKQISPNMGPNETNLLAPLDRKKAIAQLTRICASHISSEDMERLKKNKYPWITMRIRTDINGKPLELELDVQANSNLTLEQMEKIERDILQNVSFRLAPYTNNVVKGSNFLTFLYGIHYDNMLKIKNTDN
ncbi:MAG: hypothetical protein ACO1N4_03135 [Pedobacter sp.]